MPSGSIVLEGERSWLTSIAAKLGRGATEAGRRGMPSKTGAIRPHRYSEGLDVSAEVLVIGGGPAGAWGRGGRSGRPHHPGRQGLSGHQRRDGAFQYRDLVRAAGRGPPRCDRAAAAAHWRSCRSAVARAHARYGVGKAPRLGRLGLSVQEGGESLAERPILRVGEARRASPTAPDQSRPAESSTLSTGIHTILVYLKPDTPISGLLHRPFGIRCVSGAWP